MKIPKKNNGETPEGDTPGATPTGDTPGETFEGDTPGETFEGEINQIPSLSKVVLKHIRENKFYTFANNFIPIEEQKKIGKDNSASHNEKFKDYFHAEDDIFYCNLDDNQVNGKYCYKENEICPNCMKLNQQYHKLKSNYLINAAGRVCTYKKGKIFCLGKFQRVNKEIKKLGKGQESKIVYFLDLTCNGKIQCEPCETIQKYMNKYYSSKMMEKLLKRDEKLGY